MAQSLEKLNADIKSRLASLGNAMGGGFMGTRAAAVPAAPAKDAPPRNLEAQALFDIKKTLLTQVRASVPEGERPTLEHYRLACEAFTQTPQGQAMAARNEWNPKVFADLSGQDLSGFTISEPKKQLSAHHLDLMVPPLEEQQAADRRLESSVDLHDRDGDGKINVAAANPFYDNIRFDKADLHGAWVEPATSFNTEIAKAENLKDMTFNGMQEGDTFTFRSGVHENARMTNIDGGEIRFDNNSQVNGVSIEGKAAKITVGDHASVDHIDVSNEFRIIELNMGKNSVISNSDLGQSTVSMTSHFEPGATFQNVHLSGNLSGLDFSGLKLNNVTIGDERTPITQASQLDALGITHDAGTKIIASNSVSPAHGTGHEELSDLARIRMTMQHAVADLTQPGAVTPPATIGAIGAALKAAEQSIGKPLTQLENEALIALNQAREARLHEQHHDNFHALPRKS